MKEFRTEGFSGPTAVVERKSAATETEQIRLSAPREWPALLKLAACTASAFLGIAAMYPIIWGVQAAECPRDALMVGEKTHLTWNYLLFPSALMFYFCLSAIAFGFGKTLRTSFGVGPFTGKGAPWPQVITGTTIVAGAIVIPAAIVMTGSSYCFMQSGIIEHALGRRPVLFGWHDVYSVKSHCYYEHSKSSGEWVDNYEVILKSGAVVGAKKPRALRADARGALMKKMFSQNIVWDDTGIEPGCPFPDYRQQLQA